ncbi:hypothetical protein CHS0354_007788 [Potamilus streckersoni]|uniref:Uncharacterized protein n=1 Tax=Potamilus streckersoni TaxID=2493646 RepID=A0AAE0TEW9_9BIVA|nr:hypothetical protein CHS0354_007788 [Potamilus streckersoni]
MFSFDDGRGQDLLLLSNQAWEYVKILSDFWMNMTMYSRIFGFICLILIDINCNVETDIYTAVIFSEVKCRFILVVDLLGKFHFWSSQCQSCMYHYFNKKMY